MNLEEEHAHFLKAGYPEERWQQVLESRRKWDLRMLILRDWSNEQNTETAIPQPKAINNDTAQSLRAHINYLQTKLNQHMDNGKNKDRI